MFYDDLENIVWKKSPFIPIIYTQCMKLTICIVLKHCETLLSYVFFFNHKIMGVTIQMNLSRKSSLQHSRFDLGDKHSLYENVEFLLILSLFVVKEAGNVSHLASS